MHPYNRKADGAVEVDEASGGITAHFDYESHQFLQLR